jgi:hypothetical protein
MDLPCRDGEARELPTKCRLTIRRGDVFRHVLGGAGGWVIRQNAIRRVSPTMPPRGLD